ncbi:hypothetical protein EDC04DRAFT_2769855 [Pisolithus marmoratus]|nr:hypothetical protein EDC04DRAFT_2769855 [Pisolithus marmoratus]
MDPKILRGSTPRKPPRRQLTAQDGGALSTRHTDGFHKPCVLDVNLGTVLYDEDALPDKKERMPHTAARATSLDMGVRLMGSQVYIAVDICVCTWEIV